MGCGSRAKTLYFPAAEHVYTITDVDNALRHTHTQHDKPTEEHILLAAVVHSAPASSFTVFIPITVNTPAVESLPLVSPTSSFKTFQLYTR